MRNYGYIGGFICLLGLVIACGGGEITGGNHDDRDTSIGTTVAIVDTIAVSDIDTMEVAIDSSVIFEEQRKLALESTVLLFEKLAAAYDKLEEKEGEYVEEVALTSFLGQEVEIGELEISKVGEEFVRVHADYFDGAPIGGKLFLINQGELFGVEVLKLTEEITENGRVVVEKTSHTCYYKQGKVLQIWDNRKEEEIDTNSVAWCGENLEQWELVKKYL